MRVVTIRSKLSIAVSLIFVVFALVISLIAQGDFTRAYRDSVEHDLRHLNSQYAAALDANMAQATATLARVAAAVPRQAYADPASAQRFLDERIALRNLFPAGLLLIDAAGKELAALSTPEFLFPADFRTNPPPATREARFMVVPPTTGGRKTTSLPVIIGIPLPAAGGMLYGALDLHQLAFHAALLPGQHPYSAVQLYIGTAKFEHQNGDGHAATRLAYGSADAQERALLEKTLRQRETLNYRQTAAGVVISAWLQLRQSDWVVATSVPSTVAFAPLVAAKRNFAVAAVAGTAVMLLLVRLLAHRMTTALRTMTASIRAMDESGTPHPLDLTRRDEVGELARAFDRMVATIEGQRRDLGAAAQQASEAAARSEAILAALGDGLSIQDRNFRVLYQNQIHRRMVGSHLGEFCYEAYHPGNREVCVDCPVALAVTDGEVHRREGGTVIDGRQLTVELIASPLRDTSGEIVAGIELVRDISESKAAEEQIRQLNRELQLQAAELAASNRELQEFSSSLSHDLKTPLTAIYTSAQILADSNRRQLDADGNYLVDTICTTCERLEEILDGMLLLSRIGQSELCRLPVDLSAMAHEIVLGLQMIEPRRQVAVTIAEALQAEGDPRLLRSLLENLLGNAWKYTSKTATAQIDFNCIVDGEDCVYRVRDNGAGFDMAQADRLFRPFQRLHPASDFTGSGIGLATVARIVKRHGGTIVAEGVSGRGACFSFTLG